MLQVSDCLNFEGPLGYAASVEVSGQPCQPLTPGDATMLGPEPSQKPGDHGFDSRGSGLRSIHKGHCSGCPFDIGKIATEMAYNLACLPGIGEINQLCSSNGTAWACHSDRHKVCCGHASRASLPLQHMEGVHS